MEDSKQINEQAEKNLIYEMSFLQKLIIPEIKFQTKINQIEVREILLNYIYESIVIFQE